MTEARSLPARSSAKEMGAMTLLPTPLVRSSPPAWTPELQKLVGGQQTAKGLLEAVQAEYEKQLSR